MFFPEATGRVRGVSNHGVCVVGLSLLSASCRVAGHSSPAQASDDPVVPVAVRFFRTDAGLVVTSHTADAFFSLQLHGATVQTEPGDPPLFIVDENLFSVWVIPKAAFASPTASSLDVLRAHMRWEMHQQPPTSPRPSEPTTAPPMPYHEHVTRGGAPCLLWETASEPRHRISTASAITKRLFATTTLENHVVALVAYVTAEDSEAIALSRLVRNMDSFTTQEDPGALPPERPNEEDAWGWEAWLQACRNGDGDACAEGGARYFLGLNGKRRNPEHAFILHQLGCAQNNAAACYALATQHYVGDGAPQDFAKAIELLDVSCELGLPAACATLSDLVSDSTDPH